MSFLSFFKKAHPVVALMLMAASGCVSATTLQGQVVDANGNPVPQVQVIYTRGDGAIGADVITVFSDSSGQFLFPENYAETFSETSDISVRALGYTQLDRLIHVGREETKAIFVIRKTDNQSDVAPASAWLARLDDRHTQSKFIMDCIDCHQVPAPEVRNYAALIDDMHAADPLAARTQSWNGIVKYMNYLTTWEFGRGRRTEDEKVDTDAVYAVNNGAEVADTLAHIFDDRLDHIEGYDWGAPLITNGNTAIWEYEVPQPNAVREALMLGTPARLWVADVAANRLIAINVATGEQEDYEVPSDVLMSPHSLHRGEDGSLWVTPLFNSIMGHLDTSTDEWKTWKLVTDDNRSPGIHDLSFGYEHVLLTDDKGRIWFSDIGNTAVGFFDPVEGNSRIWPAPQLPERSGPASLYGLVMTRDQNEVWYSQLANGVFGGFDIEKEEYIGPFALPDTNSGPRRITISDDDVIYMALYGSGQLAEFDAKTREMIGIYDLPDTASAPYTATWDPVRKVVWVPTSNGDVIYRFDPATKEIGVLPLPRTQTFLRMLDVDPETGVLITSNGNIVDIVQGPRMAIIIDPGDKAYPKKFSPVTATAPTPGR